MSLHYAAVKVSDLERSGAFYDSILAPLGWGLIKAEFYIELSETQRPGYGQISFPAKSIPAVKASFESGSAHGGDPVAEPGSAPSFGAGNYACRLTDPDGYLVEVAVAHGR